jgi:pyrroloquinoline-quinone synthase
MDIILNKVNELKMNNKYCDYLTKENKEIFIKTQIPFKDAVDNWSKILGKMITKVPSYKERIVLIKNLWDEHGNGNLEESHVITFQKFINSLSDSEIEPSENAKRSVFTFNHYLNYCCNHESWIFSIAVLGIIEYVYVDISSKIHDYISLFIDKDKINHYSCHEVLDKTHSHELFEILVPYLEQYKNEIFAGFAYGICKFDELYQGMSDDFLATTISV